MRLMEHGLSTLRKTEPSFPYGLRVLVVDDDPTWLKILEKMLKKCSYEVTTSGLAREALKLLREKKDGFDIVISDVNMPDMDGFKLLEHVGLEMDLPVIMMSVDGETSRVMKGVQHGACDYLLKPIRMKELKNIWQHVLRKRMHEIKDTESREFFEEMQFFGHGMELYDDGHFTSVGGDQFFLKKRKDVENKLDDKDSSDNFSSKKPRVMWSVDLHQKFVKAVDHIGFDKVGPKKILDLMNIPWLTRENVASHLQKYRLYLSRLQKENELKSPCSGGSKKSDDLPKNGGGDLSMQTSSTSVMQRTDAFVDDLQFLDYKHQAWNADSILNEVDLKGSNMLLLPSAEPQNRLSSDNNSSDCHRAAARPRLTMRLHHSSGLVVPKSVMNHSQPPVDLTGAVAPSYPWVTASGDELLDLSFNSDFKPCQPEVFDLKFQGECDPLYQWENCCDYLPLHHFPQKQLITTDAIQPDGDGISSTRQPSVCQNSKLGPAEIQVHSIQNSSNDMEQSISATGKANYRSFQPPILSPQVSEFSSSTSFDMMRNGNSHPLVSSQAGGLELGQVHQVLGGFEPAIGSLTSDGLCWCEGDDHNSIPNIEKTGGKPPGFLEHDFPQLIHHEAPPMPLYDVPRFDLEYLCDCMEYPVIDQGLPIS